MIILIKFIEYNPFNVVRELSEAKFNMILYVIIGLVIIVAVLLYKNGKDSTDDEFLSEIYGRELKGAVNNQSTETHSAEYLKTYTKINSLSYKKLDTMRSELAKELAMCDVVENVKGVNKTKVYADYHPTGQKYGCSTYAEAAKLLNAVVKRCKAIEGK